MSQHDTHYHPASDDAATLVEYPGTVQECPQCSPGRVPPSPTPVSPVPAHLEGRPNLASQAVQVPVSRRVKK